MSKIYCARHVGTQRIIQSIRPADRKNSITSNSNFDRLNHEVVEVEYKVIPDTEFRHSEYVDRYKIMQYPDLNPHQYLHIGMQVGVAWDPDGSRWATVTVVDMPDPSREYRLTYDNNDKKRKKPISYAQNVILECEGKTAEHCLSLSRMTQRQGQKQWSIPSYIFY